MFRPLRIGEVGRKTAGPIRLRMAAAVTGEQGRLHRSAASGEFGADGAGVRAAAQGAVSPARRRLWR